MDLALAIARTGLEAQHSNLEIISNNLANAGTTAYKRSRGEFQDLPYQVDKLPGAAVTQDTNSPVGLVRGTGVQLVGNTKTFQDGGIIQTGVASNLAITGRGFFQVQLPNGAGFAYTRDGTFHLNEQGQIVTVQGYVVQPPISVGTQPINYTVGQDGTVTIQSPGGTTQQIGQFQLGDFQNEDGLLPIGQNLYMETLASGAVTLGNPQTDGYGYLTQNGLEASNVQVVEEMVKMIEAQRTFEVVAKSITTADSMLNTLINQVT